MEENLVLLDLWASIYATRVRIALAEKGIAYKSQEEDFVNNEKSPLLLETNPLHKTIPVLIHNGKPICESLNIITYIDEIWNEKSPLLPADPYERSQARFWADYIDKKIHANSIWKNKGGEREKAKEEFLKGLKILEGVIGEDDKKPFFGGETLGFVDIALLPVSCWFYTLETLANFSVEAECPKIVEWVKRCKEKESVSKSLADPQKVYDFILPLLQRMGLVGDD
ncbi:hypothetical protein ACH5RR_010305 [Cinchona calisaya]|uniref:glutathione transferase n=1 Tax=Cinchona calisaya TaxID=153742 RepID=A0ABD3AH57_9GENT